MGDRLWASISSRCVTSQLGQFSLASSGVAKSSTSFGWGKGWNVTSDGWQVTLCDPIWHVSSCSRVATLVSELLYPYLSVLLKATSRGGSGHSSNIWFLGPTRFHNPNGISINSAAFAGLTIVTDRPTDRQTTLLRLKH